MILTLTRRTISDGARVVIVNKLLINTQITVKNVTFCDRNVAYCAVQLTGSRPCQRHALTVDLQLTRQISIDNGELFDGK